MDEGEALRVAVGAGMVGAAEEWTAVALEEAAGQMVVEVVGATREVAPLEEVAGEPG